MMRYGMMIANWFCCILRTIFIHTAISLWQFQSQFNLRLCDTCITIIGIEDIVLVGKNLKSPLISNSKYKTKNSRLRSCKIYKSSVS